MNLKYGIEAYIQSVDEPQLDCCIESVKNQTVRFSKVSHVNNISPESEARRKIIKELEYEYAMVIAGDIVLDPDVVERFYSLWLPIFEGKDRIYEIVLGLFDEFLEWNICGLGMFRVEVAKKFKIGNTLNNDTLLNKKICRENVFLKLWRKGITVGSHLSGYDPFQVFRRFYSRGVKAGWNNNKRNIEKHKKRFKELYEEKKKPIYLFAKDVIKYGFMEKEYPTSHDIRFDLEKFNQFKKGYPRWKEY